MKPLARTANVTVRQFGAETVVYDLAVRKAHSLNPVASAVRDLCDGTMDASDIAERIRAERGIAVTSESVELALEQLSRANLLVEPVNPASAERRSSRRETLKRLVTMAAIPAVVSLAVPSARAQGSVRLLSAKEAPIPGQDVRRNG